MKSYIRRKLLPFIHVLFSWSHFVLVWWVLWFTGVAVSSVVITQPSLWPSFLLSVFSPCVSTWPGCWGGMTHRLVSIIFACRETVMNRPTSISFLLKSSGNLSYVKSSAGEYFYETNTRHAPFTACALSNLPPSPSPSHTSTHFRFQKHLHQQASFPLLPEPTCIQQTLR